MLSIGIALAIAILLAHLVGLRLHHALSVAPGHARDVMPGLPAAPMMEGKAALRWDVNVRRVEQKVLAAIAGGAEGIDPDALAVRISEEREHVAAALERIREEIPCRMRVTRSGRILHDFAAEDVARLVGKRRRRRPFRFFVFLLAIGANLGAAWPVVTVLVAASLGLSEVLSDSDGAVEAGIGWIMLIVGVVLWALLFGFLFDLLLRPWARGPKLGRRRKDDEMPSGKRRKRRKHEGGTKVGGGGTTDAWFGWSWIHWGGGSSGSRSSSSSSGGGDSDSDGIGQAIVAIILIVIVAICATVIFFWLRGLWRAIAERRPELDRTSPAIWLRTAAVVDRMERYIPTNDLVGRLSRAIRRAFVHRRPVDDDLGLRILAQARRAGGRVAALDIAVREAMSPGAAIDACSRVAGIVGGELLVTDEGELVFSFPEHVLGEIDAETDDDLWAEYLTFAQKGPQVERRADLFPDKLPVNMVGVSWGHLQASSRLVAGSWLMPLSAWVLLDVDGSPWGSPAVWTLALLAVGATVLAAATRYVAKALAAQGVRRDARRALFQEIVEALRDGHEQVDLAMAVRNTRASLSLAWPAITPEDLRKEMEGAVIDLDLPPLEDGTRDRYGISGLRARLARAVAAPDEDIEGLPALVEAVETTASVETDDPVVFDTELGKERVVVLA